MSGQDRLVAVADVLGFTQMVLSNPLEWVLRNPVDFIRRCLRHSAHQSGWPGDYSPTLEETRSQRRVGVAWFSDTIVLYALSDSNEHCEAVVETAAWLVFETFHGRHTPLRVGIDYDEFHADDENNIFVGRALIGAYHLEQAQDWVGGAFTNRASDRVTGIGVDDFITAYSVPTKSLLPSPMALKWFAIPHQPFQLRFEPPGLELASAPSVEVSESIRRKWQNTKEFHRTACEVCVANRRGA
jgi:hypothetical protein